MKTEDQKNRPDWTLVLRRRPLRIVDGRPVGGYSDEFEMVCSECGDDPGLDYREVPPGLQRVRGPYPIAAGIAAYVRHAGLHSVPAATSVTDGSGVRRAG